MNGQSKNQKRIITLFDYVSRKQQPSIIKEASKHQKGSSKRSYESSYGFETLLHFNDSLNLSSIKSHQESSYLQPSHRNTINKTTKYDSLIYRAKQDAQKLKNKRIDYQLEWKNRNKHVQDEIVQDQLNESSAQSQVTSYNLHSQIYPIRNAEVSRQTFEDPFALQLKTQIIKGKALRLIQKLKDIYMLKFLAELKLYNNIIDFKSKWSLKIRQNVFFYWKDVIKQVESRRYIRAAIIARTKQRQEHKKEEEYIQKILNG